MVDPFRTGQPPPELSENPPYTPGKSGKGLLGPITKGRGRRGSNPNAAQKTVAPPPGESPAGFVPDMSWLTEARALERAKMAAGKAARAALKKT